MSKLRIILLSVIFIPLFFCSARAAMITLKSGKVVEGKIAERAKDYIRVKYEGNEVYYENKYIKSIDGVDVGAPVAVTQEKKPTEGTTPSFKKGIELASGGKFEEAKQEFEQELNDIKSGLTILDDVEKGSISKEYAIYLFQGSLHIINEEYDLAATSLEKAWEMNPKDPDVNYNLGFVYYSLGEYKKSAVYLYAALKLQPDDTGAYELLAKAYYNIGEYQKAREDLLIARELFKKSNDEHGVARVNSFLEMIPSQTNN